MFRISVSEDLINWEDVLQDTLEDAAGMYCDVPMQSFALTQPRSEQYVKFSALSYYGTGAGLQYIGFQGRALQ